MSEFERNLFPSDEWYTPPDIFQALGVTFDLDPCSPGHGHWVPAKSVYTKQDDGLSKPWEGSVFMNPPFGGRHGHLPWLRKFISHGNGIAIVRAYTSSGWFHSFIPSVHAILFPKGKTKFIRPNGDVGSCPGHGVVMLAMGMQHTDTLRRSGLGIYYENGVNHDPAR